MGKRRNLNGLPNSLEQRYFSTLFWWDKAYMADWIWNAANEKNVANIEIDILEGTVQPKELEIKPIVAQLPKLRETIVATLENTNFATDFIVAAKFKIYISQKHKILRLLSCQGLVVDRDGHIYEGKTYTEKAYENPFKVFPISWRDRIKDLVKSDNSKLFTFKFKVLLIHFD